jgi:hypothetical protein
VLKPGGRIAVSDVVATRELPDSLRAHAAALTGCVSGAASVEALRTMLEAAGFEKISIRVNEASREFIRDWVPGSGVEDYVASATIEAVKPGGESCCGPACCS